MAITAQRAPQQFSLKGLRGPLYAEAKTLGMTPGGVVRLALKTMFRGAVDKGVLPASYQPGIPPDRAPASGGKRYKQTDSPGDFMSFNLDEVGDAATLLHAEFGIPVGRQCWMALAFFLRGQQGRRGDLEWSAVVEVVVEEAKGHLNDSLLDVFALAELG